MLIAVTEINKRTTEKAPWDTRINTDRIEYLRLDDKDCYITFSSRDSITITCKSAKRLIEAIGGE